MPNEELNELRAEAAHLAAAEAEARWSDLAGLPLPSSAAARMRAHPRCASHDGVSLAQDVLEPAEDSRGRGRFARLSSLRDFVVRMRAQALEPGAIDAFVTAARTAPVRVSGDPGLQGPRPLRVAERELPFVRERHWRAELEAAIASVELPFDARFEAAQTALTELGLGEADEASVALQARGWSFPERSVAPAPQSPLVPSAQELRAHVPAQSDVEAACTELLQRTEGVTRDLWAWLLARHTGSRGDFERHDVLSLQFAPSCASAFPRGELVRTVRRWASELRLDLSRLKLVEEERPLQAPFAHAVAVDPPDSVRLLLLPAEGPRALASLLGAVSAGLLRALPPGDAPPEDLWFGDPALPHACAALLSALAVDPLWLRRCAKTDLGRDDERALAAAALIDVRLCAARTLASLEALREGPGARAQSLARELHLRATLGALPAGLAGRELDPWLDSWAELRGRAFAARARAFLRDRYDEDWWRNPRALAPLQSLWSRGGRPTLHELWLEIAPDEACSLSALCSELEIR